MKKIVPNEDTAMKYLTAMLALKKYKLKAVILNRHHSNNRYVADFSFICKDTAGKAHIDTGMTLLDADYIFFLMSLQKRFPQCGLLDLTEDKDKPVFNNIALDNIDTVTAPTEGSEKNDISTDKAT